MGSFKRVLVLSMILVSCFATVAFASAFRIGDQGSEVAEIQGQLASLGYDVAADGVPSFLGYFSFHIPFSLRKENFSRRYYFRRLPESF